MDTLTILQKRLADMEEVMHTTRNTVSDHEDLALEAMQKPRIFKHFVGCSGRAGGFPRVLHSRDHFQGNPEELSG